MNDAVRAFETGAVRDKDHGKLDFEGFLSPRVLAIFGAYMHRNRKTAAGFRDSDNWQKGIPRDAYMKSMWRHLFDVWSMHRGETPAIRFADDGSPLDPETMEDALAGLMFNVMGYLYEVSRPAPSIAVARRGEPIENIVRFMREINDLPATEAKDSTARKFLCDCLPEHQPCRCDTNGRF